MYGKFILLVTGIPGYWNSLQQYNAIHQALATIQQQQQAGLQQQLQNQQMRVIAPPHQQSQQNQMQHLDQGVKWSTAATTNNIIVSDAITSQVCFSC